MKKKRKCELLNVKKYLKNNKFFFINHLHNVNKKQDKNITFFFVRKFIYFAFFKKRLHSRNNTIEKEQTLRKQKLK